MHPSDISTACPPLSSSLSPSAPSAALRETVPPHGARRVLFVRSGGGMPGLDIHAGIWLALEATGIHATHCAGTSAGAVVSALDAAGHTAGKAAGIVHALTDRDVRRQVPLWRLRAPWVDYWLRHDPIRAILAGLLPPVRDELVKPLACYCCDYETRQVLDAMGVEGLSPADAVLASMSISGIFEPLRHAGREYVDAGPRRNLPLPADWRAYDEVWLLVASPRPSYPGRRGILTRLLWNLEAYQIDQIERTLEKTAAAQDGPPVHVLWPEIAQRGGMLHFDHRLIAEAYHDTQARLAHLRRCGTLPPAPPDQPLPSAAPARAAAPVHAPSAVPADPGVESAVPGRSCIPPDPRAPSAAPAGLRSTGLL